MSDVTDLLIETADRLFRDHVTPDVRAGVDDGDWPETLWAAMDAAGLTDAALPEPFGSGADKSDAAAILWRAGYHATPGPLVETTLAGWVLAATTSLPTPSRTVAALDLHHMPLRLGAVAPTLARVSWGNMAEAVLAWGRDAEDRPCLLRLTGGAATAGIDMAGEPTADIAFREPELASAEQIAPGDALDPDIVLAWGAVLTCAQMAGALERALDDSLLHAQERVQFGRAIGKFQAVQQLLAEAAGEVAAAGAITGAALEALDEDDRDRFCLIAAAAKARVGEAAGRVATISHQVHGAIGYSREHHLHRATRRLWRGRDAFGGERYWQARLGRAALAAGGEGLWPLLTGH